MVRKPLPDELDRRILAELTRNARASNRAIARALRVSAPTVAQRIRRMEDVGLIRGYRVETSMELGRREPSRPGLACAHCKGPIHGPARTRQFHGRTFAFCCSVCEEAYAARFRRLGAGSTRRNPPPIA